MLGECISTPHISYTQRKPPIVLRVDGLLRVCLFNFYLFI